MHYGGLFLNRFSRQDGLVAQGQNSESHMGWGGGVNNRDRSIGSYDYINSLSHVELHLNSNCNGPAIECTSFAKSGRRRYTKIWGAN